MFHENPLLAPQAQAADPEVALSELEVFHGPLRFSGAARRTPTAGDPGRQGRSLSLVLFVRRRFPERVREHLGDTHAATQLRLALEALIVQLGSYPFYPRVELGLI